MCPYSLPQQCRLPLGGGTLILEIWIGEVQNYMEVISHVLLFSSHEERSG